MIATSLGTNRTSSAGSSPLAPTIVKVGTSYIWTGVIPAGKEVTISISGRYFYVKALSGIAVNAGDLPALQSSIAANIRYDSNAPMVYLANQGLNLSPLTVDQFSFVRVSHTYVVDIALAIFIGFDQFQNDRLLIAPAQPAYFADIASDFTGVYDFFTVGLPQLQLLTSLTVYNSGAGDITIITTVGGVRTLHAGQSVSWAAQSPGSFIAGIFSIDCSASSATIITLSAPL